MNKKIMQPHTNKIEEKLSVGIIGCGWLGTALALSLLKNDVSVLATSSQLKNVKELTLQGISAQPLILPAATELLEQHDVFTQQCLVIAIPPQFKQGLTDYGDKIAQLVSAAQKRGMVQRIILLSSTAIYQGSAGKVDENHLPHLSFEKVQVLHQAEQAVLKFNQQSNVLRLGGLVGPNRHPGKFILANKTLSNATAPVNLIHQQDAVGLIVALLKSTSPQGIFNGVSDTHVSKQQYYQVAANALSFQPPIFSKEHGDEKMRVVSGTKAKHLLNYQFIYSDLLAWL